MGVVLIAPKATRTFAAKIGVVHLNLVLQAFRRVAFEHAGPVLAPIHTLCPWRAIDA